MIESVTTTSPTLEHTSSPATMSTALGRVVLIACAVIAAASLATVAIALPQGAPTSSDPGAPVVPWWVVLVPAVVGIALTMVLPHRAPAQPSVVENRARHAAATWSLLALAIVFPLVSGVFDLGGGEGYVLAKLVLLIAVPALIVGVLRGVRLDRVRGAWRWWAAGVVVMVWTLLSQVAPWNPPTDLSGFDLTTLIVSATATAITAGLGEELFYRRWLQTRLEASLGAWAGIALASLVFALMHLGSHSTGEPVLDIARVVVAQGSFGFFLGVLWWKYRNLTAIVVAHVIVNGWPVAAELAS
ncbi:Membrane protease YdiL, CAAX protease family [Agreia pratensis]|uniref:Membrane protease YdiL, CAAX protease family n=1 Tax=Agreia pratensis TaxID=150121 RepID=A0A1X7KT40_9MICO|nr:Membrane protease YdiL, CAAX protease family [Agreia pratensis]